MVVQITRAVSGSLLVRIAKKDFPKVRKVSWSGDAGEESEKEKEKEKSHFPLGKRHEKTQKNFNYYVPFGGHFT